jgi:hypothetical protein
MQKERVLIPKDAGKWSYRCLGLGKSQERSEISGRILQKPFRNLKTDIPWCLTKYCSHHTEISTKDILTLPHDKVLGHQWRPDRE